MKFLYLLEHIHHACNIFSYRIRCGCLWKPKNHRSNIIFFQTLQAEGNAFLTFFESFLCEDAWINVFPHMITYMIFFFCQFNQYLLDFRGFISAIYFFRIFFLLAHWFPWSGCLGPYGVAVVPFFEWETLASEGARQAYLLHPMARSVSGFWNIWDFQIFFGTPNAPLGFVDDGGWEGNGSDIRDRSKGRRTGSVKEISTPPSQKLTCAVIGHNFRAPRVRFY